MALQIATLWPGLHSIGRGMHTPLSPRRRVLPDNVHRPNILFMSEAMLETNEFQSQNTFGFLF
jgi:hypothetical protein